MARQENTPLAWGWRIRAATDSAAGLAVPFTDFAPMWVNSHGHSCSTPDRHGDPPYSSRRLIKPPDTVGEPISTRQGCGCSFGFSLVLGLQ
jgi:hypothetical protein